MTTTRAYSVGDTVTITRLNTEARITSTDGNRFCGTCHCRPIDPDHHGDGSDCCPGPFYLVAYTCPDGRGHEHANETYAEDELHPAHS